MSIEPGIDQKLLVLWKTVQVCIVERIHLRLCLLYGCTRLEPADVVPAVVVPGIVGLLLSRKGQRNPESRFGIHELKTLWHYSDNGERTAAETDRLVDRFPSSGIKLLPEAITQDDLLLISDLAFTVVEYPALNGRHAQQPEQRWSRRHSTS